ncbi:MAG: hypothetical protein KAK00_11015 [Nanoarchaeota archaeon]|nr:hypothetical protein [Nanoarchaeota archaeon]
MTEESNPYVSKLKRELEYEIFRTLPLNAQERVLNNLDSAISHVRVFKKDMDKNNFVSLMDSLEGKRKELRVLYKISSQTRLKRFD